MEFETKCLHSGYSPKNGEPSAMPIYQSITYKYDKTEEVAALFDLSKPGHMYSRISNPTVEYVEQKLAELEGGVAAVCTSSGQSANLNAILNIASVGDHIVAAGNIYGGTFNTITVTLKKMGIECTMVNPDSPVDELLAAFRPNTKLYFAETISNPGVCVLDIEKAAYIAHSNGVPLIVDNTFATPFLCRPFEFGADIVTHSSSKYLDGHGLCIGGAVVDGGKFDWTNGNFPGLCTPDQSYHGIVYTEVFGAAAFAVKLRVQLVRDIGNYMQAQTAFLLNLGLETLPLRMERYCSNAKNVAWYLSTHPAVEYVSYPDLPTDKYYLLTQKYLPNGAAGVMSVILKGDREAGARFIDSLKLCRLEVHVADIRTCVLHPASATHRQLSDDQLSAAGISPAMVRLSVGLENVDDIIADLCQALA